MGPILYEPVRVLRAKDAETVYPTGWLGQEWIHYHCTADGSRYSAPCTSRMRYCEVKVDRARRDDGHAAVLQRRRCRAHGGQWAACRGRLASSSVIFLHSAAISSSAIFLRARRFPGFCSGSWTSSRVRGREDADNGVVSAPVVTLELPWSSF
jgi:hypothetical protein